MVTEWLCGGVRSAVSMSLRSLCRRYRSVLHVNWYDHHQHHDTDLPIGREAETS